jgi:flagellar basal body rod protein FlgC
MVAAPNVDPANEVAQQLIANYSFAMNARVVRADEEMTKTLRDAAV